MGPVYLPSWLYAHHANLPWVAVHLTGHAELPPLFTSNFFEVPLGSLIILSLAFLAFLGFGSSSSSPASPALVSLPAAALLKADRMALSLLWNTTSAASWKALPIDALGFVVMTRRALFIADVIVPAICNGDW